MGSGLDLPRGPHSCRGQIIGEIRHSVGGRSWRVPGQRA